MRFGRLVGVDLASIVLATATGVTLAALGFGLWALVANHATYSVVRAAGLWLAGVERTRPKFHADDARWLLRFGLPLWLGGLATAWVLKYDDLVVGSLRDKQTLGYYGRAYALALLPLGLVSGVLTRVSFPLYARLQADRVRLSEAFRIASGTTLRLVAPLAVGMAVVIPDVLVVMGWAQWEPMVPIFRWLLVYAMLRPLMDDAGSLFTAVGHPRLSGHTFLVLAAVLAGVCPLLTWRFGAEGAAASVGAVILGGLAVWYVRYLPRFVDIAYRRMVVWPVASAAAAGAAGLAVAAWSGLEAGLGAGAAKLGGVAAAYVAAMLALDGRQSLADLRTLRRHALARRRDDG
jgi:O-antigen/teichoic acid export membrane protein